MRHAASSVPGLSAEFTATFGDHAVDVGGQIIHAVAGGDGPPILLLHGWPQSWYSWRLVMPQLAEQHAVVAIDHRGVGGSSAAQSGFDAVTLAADAADVMRQLGHDRYAVAGHDIGMMVAYLLAADNPERVTHLALIEGILPGVTPSPPLMVDAALNELMWHVPFNRVASVNEELVRGREGIYFGYQFRSKAGRPDAIPEEARRVYVDLLRGPEALRASFDFYRDEQSTAQLAERSRRGPLAMPVLAVGGERSIGEGTAFTSRMIASHVSSQVIPEVGHFVPEEAPDQLAAALLDLLSS